MADAELPPLAPGDIVTSLRGRDRGTVALVWGILGRQRVAIVDGDAHPLGRPKPKNRRHLEALGHATELAHRIALGERLSDGEIQQALDRFQSAQENTTGEGGNGNGQGG